MAVTTKDIARICGVSRATVSRALHNTGSIKPETKQNILDTVQKLGYQPDLVARSLVKGSTMTIGVIVVDLKNQYFPLMIDAMEKRIKKENYLLNITLHENCKMTEKKLIQTLTNHRVDGLILNPVNQNKEFELWLKSLQIPYVILGHSIFNESKTVGVDEEEAGRAATRYILQKGYKNIVFVVPPLNDADGLPNYGHVQRKTGFEEAAGQSGCQYQVIEGGDYLKQVNDYMKTVGKEKPAFLCSGDYYAEQVMTDMYKNGYRAAYDYGIMGYDCIEIFQNILPSLTTVDNHVEEMGYQAADMLIRMIRGEDTPNQIQIPIQIVGGQTL